jgi:hypothetical protein
MEMSYRKRGTAGRLLTVAIAAIIGVGTALVPAVPAAAACHDISCSGLSAHAQGCAELVTAPASNYSGGIPGYGVQLRRSLPCAVFFARGTKDCHPTYTPLAYVRIQRQYSNPYGWYTTHTYYSPQIPCGGTANPAWTPMVADYGTDRARACLATDTTGNPPSTFSESAWWLCTGWV